MVIDQIELFAGDARSSTVIELSEADAQDTHEGKDSDASRGKAKVPAERKKAMRILMDLPGEVGIVDSGNRHALRLLWRRLHYFFGDECSDVCVRTISLE